MVQRTAVNKLSIQSESKNHAVSEKRSSAIRKPSSQNQDIRGKGGGDLKKKMKKARSFKASDMKKMMPSSADSAQKKKMVSASTSPNYMKPTSSSDARKERLQQVSHSSQTPDRNRSPKKLNCSKASKPMKVLKKTPSLKPVRPSMKKSSGAALYPKMNVGRATCSSTLKDSKFPAFVPLNPGGTEAEGTSAMRVCPYTYCSLNGLHHAPMPPLKRFLSARRRFLKAQKSLKFRTPASPRKNHPGEPNQEIDTGLGLCDDPMAFEVESDGSGFFVEIYAKPREEDFGSGGHFSCGDGELEFSSDESCRDFDEISMARDDETQDYLEGTEIDIKEDGPAENQINHYVEDQHPGNQPCLMPGDNTETDCCIAVGRNEESESTAESEVVASVSEASDMDLEEESIPFPDDRADFPTSSYDELDLAADSGLDDEPAFEQDGAAVGGCDESTCDADAVVEEDGKVKSPRVDVPSIDEDEASDAFDGLTRSQNNVALLYLDHVHAETEFSSQSNRSTAEETGGSEASEIIDDASSLLSGSIADVLEGPTESSKVMINNSGENDDCGDVANEAMTDEPEDGTPEPDPMTDLDIAALGRDLKQNHPDFSAEALESIISEVDSEVHPCVEIEDSTIKAEPEGSLGMEDIDESTDGNVTNAEVEISERDEKPREEESSNQEALADQSMEEEHTAKDPTEQGSSLISISVLSHEGQSSSAEDCSMRDDGIQTEDDNKSDDIETCFAVENGETIIDSGDDSNTLPAEICTNRKVRIARKRIDEDSEQMRKFNPRPPQFLPVEPDPEAEKVDLRHQMMDERKNSEEWMVDYALQQAITKLAPARKRKVALLIDAFETVMPMPKFEPHLSQSAAAFTHARPIQACS
ncbi:hypothetical protein ACLOJK_000435 [Asimina triloba]